MLRTQFNQIGALLILAALFGGGGASYGLSNLVVQIAALVILSLNYESVRGFMLNAPRPFVALVLASLALPLLQLIPLPEPVWSALPGRQLVSEAYSYANGPHWSGLTINQARTVVAFIGLIAPFTVIAVGSSLGDYRRIMQLMIALGLLALVPGIVEVLSGSGQSLLYPANRMPGVLFGLFANRNSAGLFFDCCLLLLAALPSSRRPAMGTFGKLLIAGLLTLGVILTQSRSSIALLALPVGLALVRAIATHVTKSSIRLANASRVIAVAGLATVVLFMLAPMLGQTRLGTVADRFEQGDGQRSMIWEDARFAAQRYWPIGAGMGTFDEVFQVDESLEYISQRRAGRAHNDYLELAIEAGAVGLGLAVAWALWIIHATWRAVSLPQQRWSALAGAGILLAMGLQSTLDFPLRNQTMLCLAAFALLLIIPQRKATPMDAASNGELA